MNTQTPTPTDRNETEWEGLVTGPKQQRRLDKDYPPLKGTHLNRSSARNDVT
jgi:hypothetical protein